MQRSMPPRRRMPSAASPLSSAPLPERLEDSRRNADVEARQLMAEAEQRASEETEKILAKACTECEKMQSAARANLERAAQWIAEEVVNDKWQS